MDVLSIIIIVILALFLLDYLLKPKLDFPMPSMRLPFFGHMFFFGDKPQQTFLDWSKNLGPVFMIQVLNRSVLVVNDNTVLQKMTDNGNFEGRNYSTRYNMIALADKDGIPKELFSNDADEQHIRRKKCTLGLVARMRNSPYFEELLAHTEDILIGGIKANAKQNLIDPYDAVTLAIYDYHLGVVNGAVVSQDDAMSETIVKMAKILRVCMSPAGQSLETFPWLRHFGNSTYKSLKTVEAGMDEIFKSVKKHAEENGPNQGVTSGFLTDQEMSKEPQDVMKALISSNLVGAAEPAVSSFYGIVQILAGHPEVQERLREEIYTRKLVRPFNPSEENPSPYTEAFLLESLRYLSAVPMFLRRAVKDTTLDGKSVPKDTCVIVNVYAGHHNEAVWKDPWVLRPERFLDNNGNLVPKSDPARQHFKAFGEGPKQCVGYPVIKDVCCALALALVDAFDIGPAPGIEVPHDTRQWGAAALAQLPATCQLKFTPRK